MNRVLVLAILAVPLFAMTACAILPPAPGVMPTTLQSNIGGAERSIGHVAVAFGAVASTTPWGWIVSASGAILVAIGGLYVYKKRG